MGGVGGWGRGQRRRAYTMLRQAARLELEAQLVACLQRQVVVVCQGVIATHVRVQLFREAVGSQRRAARTWRMGVGGGGGGGGHRPSR